MKREFVLLLALCAFAAAMVPRERKAVDVDTETENPTTEATKRICASTTPCGWAIYKNPYDKTDTNDVVNTYCLCEAGFSCENSEEDDTAMNSITKKCKKM